MIGFLYAVQFATLISLVAYAAYMNEARQNAAVVLLIIYCGLAITMAWPSQSPGQAFAIMHVIGAAIFALMSPSGAGLAIGGVFVAAFVSDLAFASGGIGVNTYKHILGGVFYAYCFLIWRSYHAQLVIRPILGFKNVLDKLFDRNDRDNDCADPAMDQTSAAKK